MATIARVAECCIIRYMFPVNYLLMEKYRPIFNIRTAEDLPKLCAAILQSYGLY